MYKEIEMRTINLFAETPTGDYRKSLGYQWAKYVKVNEFWTEDERKARPWEGFDAHESSTPGEDLVMSVDACKALLNDQYGKVAYRDNSSYGFFSKTAVTDDGKSISIDGLEPVATIHGAWCGGINESVYIVPEDHVEVIPDDAIIEVGGNIDETVAIVSQNETIETLELDYAHKNDFGWCNKCHSHCYGDCGVNK
jgi:hypothetical protein